jgi:hypothetical protein
MKNHLAAMSPQARGELAERLEKELLKGKARWLANFNESFENYRVNDVIYHAFIRGNTRVKGFLLSRFFSYILLPNYEVGCYLYSSETRLNRSVARKIVLTTKGSMDANQMKWSWLIMTANRVDDEAKGLIEKISDQDLAVVAVEADTGTITSSNNFLGRQARKFVRA